MEHGVTDFNLHTRFVTGAIDNVIDVIAAEMTRRSLIQGQTECFPKQANRRTIPPANMCDLFGGSHSVDTYHRFILSDNGIKQWVLQVVTGLMMFGPVDIETASMCAGRMNLSGDVCGADLYTGVDRTDQHIKTLCRWHVFH